MVSERPHIRALIRHAPIIQSISHYRYIHRLREWSESDALAARFYARFVSPGALCFDLGAHVGGRTKLLRHIGAQVVALEPQAGCCEILHELYGRDPMVSILQVAVGDYNGHAEMHTSKTGALSISSLSPEWMRAVSASGRFPGDIWNATEKCRLTTLDQLVAVFGVPQFIKIDTEGFEPEVLMGLSAPVPYLSFEYTQEFTDQAIACIHRLNAIGFSAFALSMEESFELTEWETPPAMCERLKTISGRLVWGDIYARSAAG